MKKMLLMFTGAALAAISIHAQGCDPAPAGLVAWWPAEGNANDSIGTNNGVLQGGAGFASGEVGQAFSFDASGTQAVDIAHSSSLDLTNQVTIEFWMKADPGNSMNSFQGLVTSDYYWISIDVGNPNLGVYGVDFAINDSGTFYQTANANGGGAQVSAGVWHHVAGTYDGTKLQLYVDGQPSGNPMPHSGAISPMPTNGFVSIGSEDGRVSCGCTGRHFWGLIDEASIYNRALSASEIAAIYNAGSGGKCLNPTPSTLPVITSFNPQSGSARTVVNITGLNFDPIPANNTVYFGAVQTVVSNASATNLVVSVPAGATYAPITETVRGLTAYANASFLPTFPSAGILTNASLAARLDLVTPSSPDLVAIGDLNGDGKPDLVVHCGNNTISIFQNISTNGSLTAASFGKRIDLPIGGSPSTAGGLALADLSGDGRLDIVTSSYVDGKVSIFQNFCTSGLITSNSFGARVDIPVNGGPVSLAVQDLDGDGQPDIVTGNYYNNTASVLRNLGPSAGMITSNSFADQIDYPVGSNARWVAVADLDGDGKPDLVTVDYSGSSAMSVLRNTSTVGVLTNNSFAPQVQFATLPDDAAIAIGDLDGDGKPDVVIASGAYGEAVSLFRNTSMPGSINTNSFAPRADFGLGGWANGVALGDLDGDGKLDVAAVTQLSSQLSLFRNISTPGSLTTNSLAARLDFTSGYNPYGVAIGDLDGDDRPDIIFANNYGATISIYQNAIPAGVGPSSCDPAPSGLVGWWKGDGDGSDSVGGDNATVPTGVTYAPGEVGLGFNLNGNTNRILAPDAPQLDFGPNKDFSIEAWIQPMSNPGNYTDLSGEVMTVVSKRFSPNTSVAVGYEMYLGGGRLCFQMIDSLENGGNYYNLGVEPDLRDGKFHHVAVTVQRNSTTGLRFYADGKLIATFDPTVVTGDLSNTWPLRIGNHPTTNLPAFYRGIIDEVSLYNRALSSNEIAAIYNAGGAGKCFTPTPPVIISQPTNQTVAVGGTATFSVTASGTQPLFYQWIFNGTNISSATNASLTLPNVQPVQAGDYAVLVANAGGSTNSAIAVLTVNPSSSCDPAPSGLVAWWQAEGNAYDSIGTNNGILVNGATFANGEVGQAFSFNGINQYVKVPQSSSLNSFGNQLTIEFWMYANPSNLMNNYQGLVTSDYYGVEIDNGYGGGMGVNWYINTTTGEHLISTVNGGGIPVSSGQWHHIAGTYDGAKLQLYIDGVPSGNAQTASGDILPMLATSFVAIGSSDGRTYCGCTGRYFWGLIDEVSIYNRALSSNEIAAIYNAGSGGKCLNPSPPSLHFVWNQIPSPRFVKTPFAVVIQAQNLANEVVTNFTGNVVVLSTNGVPVRPAVSGNFIQGVWTGAVAVAQTATNLVLQATDNLGNSGLANPINIVNLPPLTTIPSGNTLYIFWPVNPPGFVLETTAGFSPANWVPVTTPPYQIGNLYFLPITMSGTNAYYRLHYNGP